MRFSLLSALSSLAVVVLAGPNPFTDVPNLTAGKETTLKWTPTTGGTVTLKLREGASSDLKKGTVIESNIPNDGSYSYTPPPSTVRGSDYSIEIISDQDPGQNNFSPYFVIDSSNTVASVSAASASGTLTAASGTPSPSSMATAANSMSRSSGTAAVTSMSMTSKSVSTGTSTTMSKTSSITSAGKTSTDSAAAAATSGATVAASQPNSRAGELTVPKFLGVVAIVLGAVVAW